MTTRRWPPSGTVLGDDGVAGSLPGGEDPPHDWDEDPDTDTGDRTDADGVDRQADGVEDSAPGVTRGED